MMMVQALEVAQGSAAATSGHLAARLPQGRQPRMCSSAGAPMQLSGLPSLTALPWT